MTQEQTTRLIEMLEKIRDQLMLIFYVLCAILGAVIF